MKGKSVARFVSVFEARENFADLLSAVQALPQVITKHGKPIAVFTKAPKMAIDEMVRQLKAKFTNTRHARIGLSSLLDAAQKAPQVVMKHNKPVGVFTGAAGKEIDEIVRELEKR